MGRRDVAALVLRLGRRVQQPFEGGVRPAGRLFRGVVFAIISMNPLSAALVHVIDPEVRRRPQR